MTDIEIVEKVINSDELNWNMAKAFERRDKKIIRVYSKERPTEGIDIELTENKNIRQVHWDADEITNHYTIRIYNVGPNGRLSHNKDGYVAEVLGWWKFNELYDTRTVISYDVDKLKLAYWAKYDEVLSNSERREEEAMKKAIEEKKERERNAVIEII